jgi:hypothetical protein
MVLIIFFSSQIKLLAKVINSLIMIKEDAIFTRFLMSNLDLRKSLLQLRHTFIAGTATSPPRHLIQSKKREVVSK